MLEHIYGHLINLIALLVRSSFNHHVFIGGAGPVLAMQIRRRSGAPTPAALAA